MRPPAGARWALLLLGLARFCGAREVFHLTNGFDLKADSHTQTDNRITLKTPTGTIEISAVDVASVESLPDPLPLRIESPKPQAKNEVTDVKELLRLAALSLGDAPEFVLFVRSVAQVESGLWQGALSPKGAIGLMQLMPATARQLGVEPGDAQQNAKGGAHYLRDLLLRYNYDSVLALAAYNAGPAAVERYRGLPPYPETQQYVRRVLRIYDALTKAVRTSSPPAPSAP